MKYHWIDADQIWRQGFRNEFLLDCHSLYDDFLNSLHFELVLHQRIQMTGKICVKALITWNKLIRESKPRHKRPLLEPENGAERPREENPFHSSKGNQPLLESFISIHPFHSPLCFLLNHIDICNSIEKIIFLVIIFNISVYQKRVCFRVNVLHCDLETIETSGFRNLNLWAKLLSQVFKHDAITGGEECENILDEMFLFFIEFLPISEVLVEIDFISCPERGKMSLVHLINWMVFDWEQNEPLFVWLQNRLCNYRALENWGLFHSNTVSC